MSTLDQIVIRIIKEQELIVGPVAWSEARKVSGIRIINQKTGELVIEGSDSRIVVDHLVEQYQQLFGRASKEVCKDAAATLLADLSPTEIPSSLV
ncbi:hypothetical protein KW782_00435 [Candidatus Parcubacteria bacterium]|nr:hypothetical protein [Candidatus Parcubacteria bacterium]